MLQGDVYWADVGESSGIRPVVILTRTKILPHLNMVTVAPVTSTIRGIDTEVHVRLQITPSRESVISLDNITTLEISAIREFVEHLDEEMMLEVFGAVHSAFQMPF